MEIKEFLKTLATDPKARELMKGLEEPKDIREAANKYLEIAKELGISIPKKGLAAFLKYREKLQKEKTEQAGESVKEALSEGSLGIVAGGGATCSSTFEVGEWCWFSDSCSSMTNIYSGEKEPEPEYVGRGAGSSYDDWEDVETVKYYDPEQNECLDASRGISYEDRPEESCEDLF